jgi:hypothetical protein
MSLIDEKEVEYIFKVLKQVNSKVSGGCRSAELVGISQVRTIP